MELGTFWKMILSMSFLRVLVTWILILLMFLQVRKHQILLWKKLVEFSEEDFLDSVINRRQLYQAASLDFLKDLLRPVVRGVNQTKRTARIVQGDSKNYTFSDDAIKSLWCSLGGKDKCLKIENGLVYTYPQ